MQGNVSGIEFSPTHFQQRTFQFYEIPLIEQQITPIRRKTVNHSTLNLLRTGGFITPKPNPPTRWDLVSLTRGLTGITPNDAELLVTPLIEDKNGNNYWKDWVKAHPQQARFLWPIIQKLAVRDLYLFVPPLLEVAQRHSKANNFQDRIHLQLRSDYLRLRANLQAQDKHSMAKNMIEEAKTDFPDIVWP